MRDSGESRFDFSQPRDDSGWIDDYFLKNSDGSEFGPCFYSYSFFYLKSNGEVIWRSLGLSIDQAFRGALSIPPDNPDHAQISQQVQAMSQEFGRINQGTEADRHLKLARFLEKYIFPANSIPYYGELNPELLYHIRQNTSQLFTNRIIESNRPIFQPDPVEQISLSGDQFGMDCDSPDEKTFNDAFYDLISSSLDQLNPIKQKGNVNDINIRHGVSLASYNEKLSAFNQEVYQYKQNPNTDNPPQPLIAKVKDYFETAISTTNSGGRSKDAILITYYDQEKESIETTALSIAQAYQYQRLHRFNNNIAQTTKSDLITESALGFFQAQACARLRTSVIEKKYVSDLVEQKIYQTQQYNIKAGMRPEDMGLIVDVEKEISYIYAEIMGLKVYLDEIEKIPKDQRNKAKRESGREIPDKERRQKIELELFKVLKNKRLNLPINPQRFNYDIRNYFFHGVFHNFDKFYPTEDQHKKIQDEFEKLQQILPPVCKPHQGVIISSKPYDSHAQAQKLRLLQQLSEHDGLELHLPEKRVITFNLDNPPSDTCANVANIRIAGGLYLRVRFYNDGGNSMTTTTGFPNFPQDFAFEDSKGTIRKISDVLDDNNQIKDPNAQLNNDLQTAITQAMNPGVQPYNITQQTEMQELSSAFINRAKNLDLEIQTTITQSNGTTATQNIYFYDGLLKPLPHRPIDPDKDTDDSQGPDSRTAESKASKLDKKNVIAIVP